MKKKGKITLVKKIKERKSTDQILENHQLLLYPTFYFIFYIYFLMKNSMCYAKVK